MAQRTSKVSFHLISSCYLVGDGGGNYGVCFLSQWNQSSGPKWLVSFHLGLLISTLGFALILSSSRSPEHKRADFKVCDHIPHTVGFCAVILLQTFESWAQRVARPSTCQLADFTGSWWSLARPVGPMYPQIQVVNSRGECEVTCECPCIMLSSFSPS